VQFLKDLLHKNEHLFMKGGKFERLYPLYEAKESFLFSTREVTTSKVHVRDSLDSKRLMSTVILALIPCVLFGAYNTGYQEGLADGVVTAGAALAFGDHFNLFLNGMIAIMPVIITSYAVGGVWEVIFAVTRKHEINEGFLVTGLLFPLTLPATIPLWQVAMGVSFGVVIGKEIFGGTGMNILNPALTARAFLYFAYPVQISGDKVWIPHGEQTVDGFSGATALSWAAATEKGGDAVANLARASENHANLDFSLSNLIIGFHPGSIGETSILAIAFGALVLIVTGVGSWRIIVGTLAGTWGMAALLQLAAGENMPGFLSLPAHYHLIIGSIAFGAVFMATDPVSASRTAMGKWIYGILIGVLTVLIRVWNPAYPEGVMLAILFMNIFAPLIDHYVVQANVKRRLARVATA
jgi:Na+-transporting NADH:ubiquinone oxidoreductase subunit B